MRNLTISITLTWGFNEDERKDIRYAYEPNMDGVFNDKWETETHPGNERQTKGFPGHILGGNTLKTIWKFPLTIESHQTIETPAEFQPLVIQMQNGVPMLWALVDKDTPVVNYNIRMMGTGWETDSELINADLHLGTIQHDGYVWHYFLEGIKIIDSRQAGGTITAGKRRHFMEADKIRLMARVLWEVMDQHAYNHVPDEDRDALRDLKDGLEGLEI